MGYTKPCAVYCFVAGLAGWLSSTTVYAQGHEARVLGSYPRLYLPLAPFLAISLLVKLLAKLPVQSNG